METKICSPTKGCGQEKSVSEFDRQGKGYRYICKECIKQYRQNSKEQIKEYGKQYRQDNKERLRQYRQDIKEHIKQYRQNNKEKINEQHKQYYRRNPQRTMIRNMLCDSKRRHKEKGFSKEDYNVTKEFLLSILPEHCSVLGIKLECNYGKGVGKQSPNSPSLDRIDNSKGYTQDNVRIISWRANDLKSDSTPEERKLLHEDDLRLEKKKEEGWSCRK